MEIVSTTPPPFLPSKVKGACAKGISYEKRVGKFLAGLCIATGWKLWDHQWFEYKQGDKVYYFQPDFIIERSSSQNILVEVKLTYVDTRLQLQKYLKYLDLFGMQCFPITIVRNLTPTVPHFVDDFNKVKANSVLHLWI